MPDRHYQVKGLSSNSTSRTRDLVQRGKTLRADRVRLLARLIHRIFIGRVQLIRYYVEEKEAFYKDILGTVHAGRQAAADLCLWMTCMALILAKIFLFAAEQDSSKSVSYGAASQQAIQVKYYFQNHLSFTCVHACMLTY